MPPADATPLLYPELTETSAADGGSGPLRSPLAYLFSRHPVPSQTFCDTEILALERKGIYPLIASINPPKTSFRHPLVDQHVSPFFLNPPSAVLRALEEEARENGTWPEKLVERHRRLYGEAFKPDQRCRNALYFARLFKRRGVRHIHVHFINRATHTALFLKQVAGITYSITAHAQDFMVDLANEELLREMVRESSFTITVSDFSRKLLTGICPFAEEKISKVYNGIDLSRFIPRTWPGGPVNPALEAGHGDPVRIVSIGRLIEFKGFHKLMDACARLKRIGLPFECVIVGEGPWSERLIKQRDELGLSDSEFRFLGSLDQDGVRELLQSAHIFALASLVDEKGASDVLPTVIIEAMATGLPVISTRLAGIPEMVKHGVTGLLADPGDAEELAHHLEHLVRNPGIGQEMGRKGRIRAEQHFDCAQSADILLSLFHKHARLELRPDPDKPGNQPVTQSLQPAYYLLSTPWLDPLEIQRVILEIESLRERLPALSIRIIFAHGPAALPAGLSPMQRSFILDALFLHDGPLREASWQAFRRRSPDDFFAMEQWHAELSPEVPFPVFQTQLQTAVFIDQHLGLSGLCPGSKHDHSPGCPLFFCRGLDGLVASWCLRQLQPGVRLAYSQASETPARRGVLKQLLPSVQLARLPDPDSWRAWYAEKGQPLPTRLLGNWLDQSIDARLTRISKLETNLSFLGIKTPRRQLAENFEESIEEWAVAIRSLVPKNVTGA